jgi:hypothetical protein
MTTTQGNNKGLTKQLQHTHNVDGDHVKNLKNIVNQKHNTTPKQIIDEKG